MPTGLPQFPPAPSVYLPEAVRVDSSQFPTLKSNSTTLEASRTIASVARLFSASVTNTGADGFLQIFDSATLPADTAVPFASIPVLSGQVQFYDVALGLPMTAGISCCLSSTQATKTIMGSVGLFVIAYKL